MDTEMDKFAAMLATAKAPELRKLANDYQRSKQPLTNTEVVQVLAGELRKLPRRERESMMRDGERIVEQIYADEANREQAEHTALANRMYLTRFTTEQLKLRKR